MNTVTKTAGVFNEVTRERIRRVQNLVTELRAVCNAGGMPAVVMVNTDGGPMWDSWSFYANRTCAENRQDWHVVMDSIPGVWDGDTDHPGQGVQSDTVLVDDQKQAKEQSQGAKL